MTRNRLISISIAAIALLVSIGLISNIPKGSKSPATNPPAQIENSPASIDRSPVSTGTSVDSTRPAAGDVVVHVLDVGEGLSVLIDAGDAEVLIDGGYMKYGEAVSDYIEDYVDGNIEYVIATHSDSDHVGGLIQIYDDYQVDCTIYGDKSTSGNYLKFEEAALKEPNSDYRNDENEIFELSEGVTLRFIDPVDDASETNNNSVISILDAGGARLLITGDAQASTEKLLLRQIGKVDVYIVGHHGSETSSSQVFLDEIRPEYGIISSEGPGGRYRNPDEEIVKRLDAIGAKLYATYRSGSIIVTFADGRISVSPPAGEQITQRNYKEAA